MRIQVIIILLIHWGSYAQNLVPNPSFELYDSCTSVYSIYTERSMNFFCSNWFDNNLISESTVDYMNSCLPENYHVPDGINGHSFAQDGNRYIGASMIGFYSHNTTDELHREHPCVKLTDTLIKDSTYCVSFFYKNPNTFDKGYALDNIGILFTKDSLTYEVAQFSSAHIRTEQGVLLRNDQWEQFTGYYTANGGETYLNVGLFGNLQNTTLDFSYDGFVAFMYFFDNFSVTKCNKDSLTRVYIDLPNVFTPNNDGINDSYIINHNNIEQMQVLVYNRYGNLIFQYDGLNQTWNGTSQDGNPLVDGTYFITVSATDNQGNLLTESRLVTLFR